MSPSGLFVVLLIGYLSLNFLCALVLHLHGERQAHLRLRFLEVLVHFLLLTAFAIPVLVITTTEALFGSEDHAGAMKPAKSSPAGARAA